MALDVARGRGVTVNAIHAGSKDDDPAKWRVTQEMLEQEIAKVRKAKAEHAGEKRGPKRRIGFCKRSPTKSWKPTPISSLTRPRTVCMHRRR